MTTATAVKVFSSRIPARLNADPFPYVWPEHLRTERLTDGPLRSMFSHGDGHALMWDPRPEFGHEQTHRANPILLAHRRHRETVAALGFEPAESHLDELLLIVNGPYGNSGWTDGAGAFHLFTAEELEHARLVLTRMLRIAGKA